MVLGRIKKFADLNLQESKAFLKVCPCATVDKAKVFDCLLLSGVVYTNEVYNQIKTNDYTLSVHYNSRPSAIFREQLAKCAASIILYAYISYDHV